MSTGLGIGGFSSGNTMTFQNQTSGATGGVGSNQGSSIYDISAATGSTITENNTVAAQSLATVYEATAQGLATIATQTAQSAQAATQNPLLENPVSKTSPWVVVGTLAALATLGYYLWRGAK